MFEGWTSPFAGVEQQTQDRATAWDAIKKDPGTAALIAGLSMLSNNNGRNSFGQLVGRAGFDTLAGVGSMEAQRRDQERQAILDADRRQYRDMQMQGMQAELDEQNRRRELQHRFASGDESALKELDPIAWWKNEQAKQQAAQSLRNSMALASYKARLDAQNNRNANLQYVDGVGMVDKGTGMVLPLRTQTGEVYLSPKQRKENAEAEKQEQARENQKSFVMQNAKTQLTSLDNALSMIPESGISWNTGLTGSALSMIPGTQARNLQAELDTIGSGSMLQTMQALKAASPTGATGMGALSDSEGKILRDSLGSLDRWQSPEQLRRNLENIRSTYTNMLASWGYSPEDVASLFVASNPAGGETTTSKAAIPPLPPGFLEVN